MVSALLLFMGFGIIGAAIGYLFNDIVLRFFCGRFLEVHSEAMRKANDACAGVSISEIKERLFQWLIWRGGTALFNFAAMLPLS